MPFHPKQLLACNLFVENNQAQNVPMPDLYRFWVWDSLEEDTNHLAGALYCRALSQLGKCASLAPPIPGKIQLSDTSPTHMNLTTLSKTVDNVCIEWPAFQTRAAAPVVKAFVEQCMTRFGHLISNEWDPLVLNDSSMTEEASKGLRKLTWRAIQSFLNTFVILHRHFDLHLQSVPVDPIPFDCGIRPPHVEASSEFFDLLCMHFHIPVAARLRYKNQFKGMYNHISQVMYLHNPNYQRLPRAPIEDLAQDPVQVLPALCELYPEIEVLYEEDPIMQAKSWAWIVFPGCIFLLTPTKQVLHSKQLTALIKKFLETQ